MLRRSRSKTNKYRRSWRQSTRQLKCTEEHVHKQTSIEEADGNLQNNFTNSYECKEQHVKNQTRTEDDQKRHENRTTESIIK